MVYGSPEYRAQRDNEIRTWLDKKVQIIEDIPDGRFQAICYFSLIECFAQEYKSYPLKDLKKSFCEYVLKFQSNFSFLHEIDPVTLYYDCEEKIQGQFSLSFLENGCYYQPNDVLIREKADELTSLLTSLGIKPAHINKHSYVSLLYSLRSKLSHELSDINNMMGIRGHLLDSCPYYLSCSRSYQENGKTIRDSIWDLVMPVGFIKELALECADNYLKFSIHSKCDPFQNNVFTRKSNLSWYD